LQGEKEEKKEKKGKKKNGTGCDCDRAQRPARAMHSQEQFEWPLIDV